MEYSFKEALDKILDVKSPWTIVDITINEEQKEVNIYIEYKRGSLFKCPVCKVNSKVHDGNYRDWRHLDICDYRCYLKIKIPRIKCNAHGVKVINEMDFGRINSHFSFKFERLLISKAREMSMNAIARELGEIDTTLWNVFNHYIPNAIEKQLDLSKTTKIGVDETSIKSGHNYVTIFTDKEYGNVIYVTEGRDSETFGRMYENMYQHMGEPNNIELISMDMSRSFIAGQQMYFSNAEVVFDHFHIKNGLNESIDKVRKQEVAHNDKLKKTKYIWLRNEENLTDKQKVLLNEFLSDCSTNTAKAYSLKNGFDELWKIQNKAVEPLLTKWCDNALKLSLKPVDKFVKTIKNHWKGIINSITTHISNGFAEGFNGIAQLVKSRARGYRNPRNFINMIYFIGNKFIFNFH